MLKNTIIFSDPAGLLSKITYLDKFKQLKNALSPLPRQTDCILLPLFDTYVNPKYRNRPIRSKIALNSARGTATSAI